MKPLMRALLCIALLLMSIFLCVGYAQLTTSLAISGEADAAPPDGIFITNISEVSTSNIDKNEFSFISATTNIINHINRGTADEPGTIVYEVTVFNNTDTTYFYRDIYYITGLDEYNGNDYISEYGESTSISIECIFDGEIEDSKKLLPRESIVFKVKYTIGEEISEAIDLNMLINVRFGINVSGNAEALDMIEARFLQILNTQSTYEYLLDILDNKYDGVNDWTSNYVGNVTGATIGAFSDDSVAVNTLFQNHLQMIIDGELKEVTVIIKHENIDWDNGTGDDYIATHPSGAVQQGTGCEMTLYLTIDTLDVPYEYVTVYAMVFTCDRDWQTGAIISDWYRVGNTFVGKAEVADYDGTVGGTGSFRTTTWAPLAETYQLIDGYNFRIQNGNDVDSFDIDSFSYTVSPTYQHPMYYLLETWSDDAPVVILQLLDDARRILDNRNYAGAGIDRLRAVYEKYYWIYGYTGQPMTNWPYPSLRKFYPAMSDLYKAIVNVADEVAIKDAD